VSRLGDSVVEGQCALRRDPPELLRTILRRVIKAYYHENKMVAGNQETGCGKKSPASRLGAKLGLSNPTISMITR
jgi:hypothetical protein